MEIPHDKQTLGVFLRDYGGRRRKSPQEKVRIMKKILTQGKIRLDDHTEINLSHAQKDMLNALYHKYILGKWNTGYPAEAILDVFREEPHKGWKIDEIADELGCSAEVVRRRVIDLVNEGILIRGVNPENKRQGIFYIQSEYIVPGVEEKKMVRKDEYKTQKEQQTDAKAPKKLQTTPKY
jgi:AraC-like DNA-binding protein